MPDTPQQPASPRPRAGFSLFQLFVFLLPLTAAAVAFILLRQHFLIAAVSAVAAILLLFWPAHIAAFFAAHWSWYSGKNQRLRFEAACYFLAMLKPEARERFQREVDAHYGSAQSAGAPEEEP